MAVEWPRMAVEWWVESFYCAILCHSTAIVWPFCCHSTCVVWHVPNLCETNSISGLVHCVVQWYKQVLNYRMVLDPSFTLSAHHMHSNALSAPQVLKFAPNVYMSHVLFHVVGMLIFFLFEMSIQTLNEVAAAPFSLECPCCVAVSPTHCSKPLLFPSPLRSVCSRVAFMDTEPINTTSGAPQKVRLLVWGRKLLQHVTVQINAWIL